MGAAAQRQRTRLRRWACPNVVPAPGVISRTADITRYEKGPTMPYDKNSDLPDRVKDNLPDHAQDIFREAFNNAQKEYGNEHQAFAVAWSAVEKEYEKGADGRWHPRRKAA